ncbi:FUSC family protein [Pseudonocardia spinosispora]|uniref:FUSC family protein n=1 Tax=Pseudonocardia spinosispora TaxID=103441 RepID=UPI000408C0C7|nr:aromatic acid exporter family protein [Pseudonocardia spinosispora]
MRPTPDAVRRAWAACFRRGRTPGLRTAKTTLAAVLSFVCADLLHTSAQPILAPLTALLVVQLTLYKTLTSGLDRVAAVVSGVLVAVGVAKLTGLTWWSLGAVVGISLIIGRLLRLGSNLLEVPISAMLVLAAASTSIGFTPGSPDLDATATGRVVETLIGAAVGILVNVVIAPPLYIQPADDAIGELVGRLSGFSRELASALRGEWNRAAADRFLDGARKLGDEVVRADLHLGRTEESARLNPRGRAAREAQPRLRTALAGLEHSYVSLRNLCRAVLDRTYFVAEDDIDGAYSAATRDALAEVLDAFADTMDMVDPIATAEPSADQSRAHMETRFAELRRKRDRLAGLLVVDPRVDAAAWGQHGGLLAAVDRLRVEVEAAVRPTDGPWQPEPVSARPRAAVRRLMRRTPPIRR